MDGDEILIDRSPGETRAAILRGGRLSELLVERAHRPSRAGQVVRARVAALRPELGGAFLDLGGTEGFLDPLLSPPPAEGAALVVQIVAEARRGKAARATAAPSLHGALVTLTPGRPGLAVSRRIAAKGERARLRAAVEGAAPEGIGIVVRAAARGRPAEEVAADARAVAARWRALSERARGARTGAILEPAPGPLARARLSAPGAAEAEGRDGALFAARGIEDAIADALERRVELPGGAALAFDEAEALVAIDVDLARADRAAARPVRLAAAASAEIAWQIRLRRLAGPILVDFPRTRSAAARAALADGIAAGFRRGEPARPAVHGWTRGGLLELTRPRLGPSLAEETLAAPGAPARSAETVALEALRRLPAGAAGTGRPRLLCSRPVAAVLSGPLRLALEGLGRRLGGAIAVEAAPGLGPEDYRIEGG